MSRMIIATAGALLLAAVSVQGAEHTALVSGDWSSLNTWGEAIPGDGDSIILRDGVTVTVSDDRIIGTSGSNGTVAVNLQKSGALVIAKGGILRVRGDVVYTKGIDAITTAVTVQGGGIWRWDASKASVPQATCYNFHPSGDMGFRGFVLAGTAEAHASLDSDPAGGAGYFTRKDKHNGGQFQSAYGDIARIGDAQTPGWDLGWFRKPGGVTWDVQHTSFTQCGMIRIAVARYPGGLFRHTRNIHEATRSKFVFSALLGGSASNGVRALTGNVLDVAALENSMADGYTITGNYFGGGLSVLRLSPSWARCEGNFFRMFDKWRYISGHRLGDSFVFLDRDWDNPHVLEGTSEYDVELDGLILSHAGTANYDSGEWLHISHPGLRRSIFLPNIYGYCSGEIIAILGPASGKRWEFEHNTWFGGFKKTKEYAAIQYSEHGNTSSGVVKSFRSNILWNPQLPGKEAKFFKINDIHSMNADQRGELPTRDVGEPKNIDYNTGWKYTPDKDVDFPNKGHFNNWGKGYIGNWSRTPGEHDIDVDPRFVDYQRDLPLFATKCLGIKPSRGEWSATPAKPYVTGDTVINKTIILWGLPVLYRYIGTGANPEPGLGTRKEGDIGKWRDSWEWASLYYLREGVRTGQKFGADDIIMHLIKWVRTGYAPTNPLLKGAAHDGTDIGAVPFATGQPKSEP